jgi:hypothetical protein
MAASVTDLLRILDAVQRESVATRCSLHLRLTSVENLLGSIWVTHRYFECLPSAAGKIQLAPAQAGVDKT